jgi:MFS family permease
VIGSSLSRVLAINVLVGAAVHAVRPMVSFRALELGAGPLELGVIGGAFGLVSLVMAVVAGRWVDRRGEALYMLGGAIGVGCVAILLIVADSIPMLAAAMAALGLSQVFTAVSIQTLVANSGGSAARDARFGWQSLAASFGQLVGPLAAGFLAGTPADGSRTLPLSGLQLVFLVAAVVSVCAAALSATLVGTTDSRRERTGRPEPARSAIWRILRLPSMPRAMFASMAVLASVDILIIYVPALAQEAGISVETVGLLLAMRAAASMVSRAVVAPVRTVIGRRQLLAIAMLLPAAAIIGLPFSAPTQPAMFALMFIVGFGLGLGQPLTASWVAGQAPRELRGMAVGLRLSGNRLGQLITPAVVGVAAGAAGLSAVFWSVAIMLTAGAVFVAGAHFEELAVERAPEP